MTTLTSSLIVRLIDQVTSPARKVGSALMGLNKTANGISGTFGARLGSAIERNNAALDKTRGRMVDAVAGFYALKEAIGGPVKAAMEFESAMSDVRKVVDFPTPAAFKDFQKQLVDLSKTVPLSVNGLAQIAAAAGQAGIAGPDLIKFTEAAAKIGVAFDISADQAGDAMAKMITGLGLTIDQTVSLSDAMNYLSNAQASSASEILDVVRRVGAQAKQFGFTAEQVAAFGSAMVSAGAETDVAATSFRNMGLALTHGASATKRQRNAYKQLGMEAKTVSKSMQKDAVATTLKVMEAIAKLPKDQQAAVSSDLFGNEARALPILLTNLGLLKESLGLISDKTKYAGSSFKEYDIRAKTFANAVQLFQNRLTAMKIVIGAALIPALNDLLNRIAPVIEAITQFAQANPELTRNVIAAAAALVAFKVATTALTFAGLIGRGGALSMLSFGFNTVGRAAIGATRAAKSAVALQTALGAMSGMKMGALEKIGVGLRGIVTSIPMVGPALALLGGISLPVIGAAAAVVGLGFAVWTYRKPIITFAEGVATSFKTNFPEAALALGKLSAAMDVYAAKSVDPVDNWAAKKGRQFSDWLVENYQTLGDADLSGLGEQIGDTIFGGLKRAWDDVVAWFSGLSARITTAIGNIDISGLIKWPTPPSWWTNLMGDHPASSTPIIGTNASNDNAPSGHRARGGKVWPGGSFEVGEKGAERFTPTTAGTITPAGAGGARSVGNVTINITTIGNAKETAREIERVLADDLGFAIRGAYSDGSQW